MPIYEYACTACGNRTDILHGINESPPHFCPECGAEGTLRKGFAAPAIVFKGSGWAKKDRNSASRKQTSVSKDSSDGVATKESRPASGEASGSGSSAGSESSSISASESKSSSGSAAGAATTGGD